jgi:hypothetical protein
MITGSGVLIVTPRGIIVGHQLYKTILSKKSVYEDFGGGIKTKPKESAILETLEETANLIKLSPNLLNDYIETNNIKGNTYRMYIVGIEDFPFEEFKKNYDTIKGNPKVENYYREVNSLAIIPIKNINNKKKVNIKYNFYGKGIINEYRTILKNDKDKEIMISGRLTQLLFNEKGLEKIKNIKKFINYKNIINNSGKFIKTKTYIY